MRPFKGASICERMKGQPSIASIPTMSRVIGMTLKEGSSKQWGLQSPAAFVRHVNGTLDRSIAFDNVCHDNSIHSLSITTYTEWTIRLFSRPLHFIEWILLYELTLHHMVYKSSVEWTYALIHLVYKVTKMDCDCVLSIIQWILPKSWRYNNNY